MCIRDRVPDVVRLALGRAMRRVGPHWEACLLLCDILARHFHAFVMPRFLPSALLAGWIRWSSGLVGCWDWQPVVTAKEVAPFAEKERQLIGRAMTFFQE